MAFCFYIDKVYFYFLFPSDIMQSFSSRLSQDIEKFYPNASLLPKNVFAKGVLFTLGVVGFATMFLQPSIAQDSNNELSVSTSLTNNIMSVGTLQIKNWTTTSVVLNSTGINLPGETSNTTLLKLVNKYIKPSPLISADIWANMITTEKIADGTVSCSDLSAGLQALLCNGTTAPSLSCSPWQYLIGITTGAGAICTGGSAGGLPNCSAWQSVMRNSATATWDFYTPSTWYSVSWESLWETNEFDTTVIYNKNLAGKVGIGMTSPSATLSVSGSLLVKGNTVGTPAVGGYVWTTAYWDGIWYGYGYAPTGNFWTEYLYGYGYGYGYDPMYWYGYWYEYGYGYLPEYGYGYTYYDGNGSGPGQRWHGAPATPGGETSILYVTGANGGRVGILTSNPLYPLDVVGSIRAAAYLQSSDARLKTNISAIPDALSNLLGINWYTYNLKSDGSYHYWVIAQEIEKIFPYLVSTDENGLKSVNYNGLVAPIIESIKTLNTKIDTLEVQLDSNTSRIEALEKTQK